MIYVCSDIHGRKDRYDKIFDIVSPDDELYILGDVIDRNSGGIDILRDIMQRPNVHFLIGNHEQMLYYSCFNGMIRWLTNWTRECNGGDVTLQEFDLLSEDEKLEIKTFLDNSPIAQIINVNDKSYYLTHGFPVELESDVLLYKDADMYTIETAVWDTPFMVIGYDVASCPLDYADYHIVGHKYVQHYNHLDGQILKLKNVILIDGGCALSDDVIKQSGLDIKTNLILYCLDNDTTHYIS